MSPSHLPKQASLSFLGLAVLLPLLACKLGKSEDDPESRPLPVVSGAGGSATVQAEPPKKDTPPPPAEPAKKEEEPAKAATETTAKAGSAPATAAPKADTEKEEGEKAADGEKPAGDEKPAEPEKGDATPKPEGDLQKRMDCVNKCAQKLQQCIEKSQKEDPSKVPDCRAQLDSCRQKCL
jgi:hypothetical protein